MSGAVGKPERRGRAAAIGVVLAVHACILIALLFGRAWDVRGTCGTLMVRCAVAAGVGLWLGLACAAAVWRSGWIGRVAGGAVTVAPLAFVWPEIGVGAAVTIGAATAILTGASLATDRGRTAVEAVRRWWREPLPAATLYWILLTAVFVLIELARLPRIDPNGASEWTALVVGRAAAGACVALLLWLAVGSCAAALPRPLCILTVAVPVTVPLLWAADALLVQSWNMHLPATIDFMSEIGNLSAGEALAIAGLDAARWGAAGLLAVAGSLVLYAAFAWRGRRRRVAPRRLVLALAAVWAIVCVEQAVSPWTKRTATWQREYAVATTALTPFAPPLGIVSIPVTLRAAERRAAPLPSAAAPGPDVFIVVVDSLRSQAVTEATMPWLTEFARASCQPVERTFAASPCTPISWFGIFHGRAGFRWRSAVSEGREGAPPLRVLRSAGYRLEVRGASYLSYQAIGNMCFGRDYALADVMTDQHAMTDLSYSRRDERVVADTLEAVRDNPAGGTIYVLALDATHLPYSWDEACEVPHDDFAPRVDFIRWHWSEAEVGAVRRRYENAARFADRLCERLVSGLQAEGRLAGSLVVITGDHGEELHEFGTWSHGSRMHRFQTEVPLIVKWPEGVLSRHRHSIAGHLDIMPSVLDCAGIPTECRPPLDGRSLLDPPRDRAVVSTTMGDERTPSLCLVDREGKAVFGCTRRDDRLPTALHLQRWTDLDDAPSSADPGIGSEAHEDRIHHRFGAWLGELGVSTKDRPPR